jgi:hypothetical protein
MLGYNKVKPKCQLEENGSKGFLGNSISRAQYLYCPEYGFNYEVDTCEQRQRAEIMDARMRRYVRHLRFICGILSWSHQRASIASGLFLSGS